MTNEITTTEDTTPTIFEKGLRVAYYRPETPALDRNKQPFCKGGRVITCVSGKEYEVIYRTYHKDHVIQSIYEEFKMIDNKLFWLSDNRDRLQKYDINVDALIETYKNV